MTDPISTTNTNEIVQKRENNPKTDWALTTLRYGIGPFATCYKDRIKNTVRDDGEGGCVISIHLCGQCRSVNKSISFKHRMDCPRNAPTPIEEEVDLEKEKGAEKPVDEMIPEAKRGKK